LINLKISIKLFSKLFTELQLTTCDGKLFPILWHNTSQADVCSGFKAISDVMKSGQNTFSHGIFGYFSIH